jgi:nitroreductase
MTDSSASTRSRTARAFEAAARWSLHAPSIFNTQPWRWRVTSDSLELRADPSRRLVSTDPQGRLLMLSCGAAVHHARVALAAEGWDAAVDRTPERDEPGLLARIRIDRQTAPDPQAQQLCRAITRRRSDRRAFGERQVPHWLLTRLRAVVEDQGAYLHVVRRDQMPMLATSTARAATDELNDPAYRAELDAWTHRPENSRDGVPAATAVQPAPRRVPVRNYTPDATAGLRPGEGFDLGAAFVVLYGTADDPAGWLRGGEALSALLLTATVHGLATAPVSDTTEVEWPRRLLRDLLAEVGEPYLVVRLGYSDTTEEVPPAPRRDAREAIEIDE